MLRGEYAPLLARETMKVMREQRIDGS